LLLFEESHIPCTNFYVFYVYNLINLAFVEGYIFACWSDLDDHGKMMMTVPLNDMMRMAAASLAPSTPPMPVHPFFAQSLAPSQTFAPPSWTEGNEVDYYGGEHGKVDSY
jgi:hypothetical protein